MLEERGFGEEEEEEEEVLDESGPGKLFFLSLGLTVLQGAPRCGFMRRLIGQFSSSSLMASNYSIPLIPAGTLKCPAMPWPNLTSLSTSCATAFHHE